MKWKNIIKEMIFDQFLQITVKAKDAGCATVAQIVNAPKQIYVNAVLGSDSNAGSLKLPYKTIQHAVNKALAGDTINVMDGTYHEQVKFTKSGTEKAPITLRNHPGHSPVIDGTGIEWGDSSTGALVQFNRHNHLVIEGLSIQNSAAFGIGDLKPFAGVLNNIIIRNCSTTNTFGSGIYIINAKNIEIDGCTVTGACANTWDECITLQKVDGFEVKDCQVYDGLKEGIDAKDGSRNGEIHGCTVSNVHSVGIYIDAYSGHQYNIQVFNNTISEIAGSGISTGVENGGKLEGVVIRNNTILSCDRGITIAAFNEQAGTPYVLQDIIVRNNVTFDVLYSGMFILSKVNNILIENNILFTGELSTAYGIHVYDLALTDLSELTIRNNFFQEPGESADEPIGIDALVLLELEGTRTAYDTVFKDATGELTGVRDFSLADDSYARGAGYQGQDMGSHFQSAEASSESVENDEEPPKTSTVHAAASTYNRGKIMFVKSGAGIADGVYVCMKQADKKYIGAADMVWGFFDIMLTAILIPSIIAILLLSKKVRALATGIFTSNPYDKKDQNDEKRKK